jgi:hypothetical protein
VGARNRGRAYLYRGGPSFDATADLLPDGDATGDASRFGWSVAGAGDANGDGFGDLLVGAYGENGGNGRAYLFRGGASLDPASDLTLSGNGYFGWSVASIPRGVEAGLRLFAGSPRRSARSRPG